MLLCLVRELSAVRDTAEEVRAEVRREAGRELLQLRARADIIQQETLSRLDTAHQQCSARIEGCLAETTQMCDQVGKV